MLAPQPTILFYWIGSTHIAHVDLMYCYVLSKERNDTNCFVAGIHCVFSFCTESQSIEQLAVVTDHLKLKSPLDTYQQSTKSTIHTINPLIQSIWFDTAYQSWASIQFNILHHYLFFFYTDKLSKVCDSLLAIKQYIYIHTFKKTKKKEKKTCNLQL